MENSRGSYNIKLSNREKNINLEQFKIFKDKAYLFDFNDDNIKLISIKSTHPIHDGESRLKNLNDIINSFYFNFIYSIAWDDRVGGYFLKVMFNMEYMSYINKLDINFIEFAAPTFIPSNIKLKFFLESLVKEPKRYKINPIKYGYSEDNNSPMD